MKYLNYTLIRFIIKTYFYIMEDQGKKSDLGVEILTLSFSFT